MLIQFTVENFLSFKEKTVFSLLATNDEAHPEHLLTRATGKNKNALRAAAIYGANASGKSNIIKAIKFARDLIVKGTDTNKSIAVTPFKLGSNSNQHSRFQFIFAHSNIEYSYGFTLNSSRIMEEFLYANPNGREAIYFERVTSDNLETEVDFGAILTKGSKETRSFLKYKVADTRPNQLLLTALFEGNLKNRVEELKPVMAWFRNVLTIIEAESQYRSLEVRTHNTTALQNYLAAFLRTSDTGIQGVKTTEVILDWDRDFPGVPLSIRDELCQEFKNRNQSEMGTAKDYRLLEISGLHDTRVYIRQNENGELLLLQLHLEHMGGEGKAINFHIDEESDGTQRMIHLAPILFDISEGKEKVILIDELDRRLHPHLSRLIILAALQSQSKNQLLFTTHDTNLLDLDLLRRDEIWFVEKDKIGKSHLYSLAEFKVRPDLQIEKGYLNGRFGAIPFIGDVNSLGWNEKTEAPPKESVHA